MYVYKGLDCNAVHIKPSTDAWLYKNQDSWDCHLKFARCDDGWIIWVFSVEDDDEELSRLPVDLAVCIRFAYENDCRIITIDRDAELVDELPTYNKEWNEYFLNVDENDFSSKNEVE